MNDQARLYQEAKARAEHDQESLRTTVIMALAGVTVVSIICGVAAIFLSGCATMKIQTPDGCAVCSVRSLTLLGDTALTATTTINGKTGVSQESCDTPGQSANGIIASLAAAGVLAGAGGVAAPAPSYRASTPTTCGAAAQ